MSVGVNERDSGGVCTGSVRVIDGTVVVVMQWVVRRWSLRQRERADDVILQRTVFRRIQLCRRLSVANSVCVSRWTVQCDWRWPVHVMLAWAVWKHICDDECVVQRIVRRGSMGHRSSDDVVVQRCMQCRILRSRGLS